MFLDKVCCSILAIINEFNFNSTVQFLLLRHFYCCYIYRKFTRSATKDLNLARELEEERKRNASLLAKLKKAKSDNRRLEQSMDGSFVRMHSTIREDNTGNEQNSVFMASMSNLSFGSLNVPECKPFDGEEEIDRKSFEQWRHMLEASMQLAGVVDETTKMNIFTIKAGPKLLDVLEGTVTHSDSPDVAIFPYANAIHRLTAFFGSRDYIFMQRQKLRSLSQIAGETDVKYVKRVIAIAKLCDFNDTNLVEQVADSVQQHALNRRVREAGRKILRKGGSLADLLDKVRTLEMDQLNEDLFAKNHQQSAQVAAVSLDGRRNQNDRDNNGFGSARNQANVQQYQRGANNAFGMARSNRNVERRFTSSWGTGRGGRGFARRNFVRNLSRIPCWRCTSRQHQPSECYAIDQVCRNCNVKGHFERACHQRAPGTSSAGSTKRRYSNETQQSSSRPKKIALVKKDEDDLMDEPVSVSTNV